MKKLSKVLIALVFCISVLASTAMFSSAALDKVTDLKATDVSVNKVTLSWTAVKNAAEYQIRVYEGSTLKKTIDTNSSSTTYTVTGLTPGKTYGFSVRAYRSILNTGSYSSKISVKTGVSDIASLKATASVTSVKLSWSKITGASGYIVQRKSGSSWKTVKKVTSNSLTVKDLTPGTKYSFRVRAYVKYNGKTYYSAYKSVSATPAVAVPNAKVTSTYNTITTKWSKLSGVGGYQIQIQKNGKWSSSKKLANTATSYKYSSLVTGTSYKVRIRAYQKATVSGKTKTYYSAWKTLSAKPALSAISTFKYSSLGTTSVTLTWSKVSGASGYKIYSYDTAKKAWKAIKTISSGSTVSHKLSISSGTSYKLMIKAFRKVSPTAYSAASKTISFVSTPATVTGLKATPSDNSIKLTWTKTNCAKYIVAYQLGSGSFVTKTVTSNSYTLSGLDGGQKYTFKVRAVNSAGTNGAYSSTVSATTYGVATKKTPTLSASSIAATSAKLSWTKIDGAKGYVIYSYENGAWKSLKKITSNTTSATVTLKSGTSYTLNVKAYGTSKSGSTVYGAASASLKLMTTPAKVSGLKVISVGDSRIDINWNATTAKGYTVEYKLSTASAYTKVNTDKTEFTLKNLEKNKDYNIRVSAYNDNDKAGSYSDVLTAKTYGGVVVTGKTESTISLSWTAINGAAEYDVYYYDAYNDKWAVSYTTSGTSFTDSSSIKLLKGKLYRVAARDTADDPATADVREGKVIYESDTCLGTAQGLEVSVDNYAVTLSWDPVADATGYTVYFYEIFNNTVSTTADGTQSVTLDKNTTSLTYYLAPGSIRRVLVYANKESSKSPYIRFAFEMPEVTTGTTAKDKNSQILYLVQAINNTKKDTSDYSVKATLTGELFYEISYLRLGFDTGSNALNWTLLQILKSQIDGKVNIVNNAILCSTPAEVSQLMQSLAETEEEAQTSGTEILNPETYTFVDGYAPLNAYSTKSLTSFLEPLSSVASYKSSQNPDKWSEAFSSITTEKVNGNQTKITAVLKAEANIGKDGSYHHGFFSNSTITGSSANLDGIVGGSNTSVTAESVGASTIIAVIDENNHLVSYEVTIPSKTHMATSSNDNVSVEGEGVNLETTFDVKLNTNSKYKYTFVEQ